MATKTKPDKLHYTGNDEADALLAHDPFALLVGFALDQQVPVPTAFQGPLKLKQRLGTLDPGQIAATDPARLEEVFREKPAIHRFPGNMARRVQDLASVVVEEYGGDAERVWREAADGADLRKRISGAARLRRDEGQGARRGALEALRRPGGGGARPRPSDARRRGLAGGARGVPGEEARLQGEVARSAVAPRTPIEEA